MSRRLALLRAVNVGGRSLAMVELRRAAAEIGLVDPETVLQTGNLLFEAEGADADVERRLEREIAGRFGHETAVLLRSAVDWAQALRANPFTEAAEAAPSRLLMVALKRPADAAAVERLQAAVRGPERVAASGRQAYLVYPEGIGRSKLTPALIERALGPGTARNWNTVLKLRERLEA